MRRLELGVLAMLLGGCASMGAEPGAGDAVLIATRHAEEPAAKPEKPATTESKGAVPMRLGNFSVSLAVKDIAASRAFYEKLGFKAVMGAEKQRWLILQNETATIGLFQGMFERNTLTFNPGWDRTCATLAEFDDVRAIQRELEAKGLKLATRADEKGVGPGSLMVIDPDGNPILVDQHVAAPKK